MTGNQRKRSQGERTPAASSASVAAAAIAIAAVNERVTPRHRRLVIMPG
jgi:hypothetical protein